MLVTVTGETSSINRPDGVAVGWLGPSRSRAGTRRCYCYCDSV